MIPKDRRDALLKILAENQSRTVEQLSSLLYVSQATVRRDLKILEASGKIDCFYGGVSLHRSDHSLSFPIRENAKATVKKRIAKEAAALLRPHTIIFIDSSTTALAMVPYLDKNMDIQVFTYCVELAIRLTEQGIRTFCMGGEYDPVDMVFYGAITEREFEKVNADIMFFSSTGIDTTEGIVSDISMRQTRLREIMLRHATCRVLLCDSSKYNLRSRYNLCTLNDIEYIINNQPMPHSFRAKQICI